MVRVLIVDDSKAMQHIVRRGLDSIGDPEIQSRLASSAKEALDIVREWEPHLILSDWHMPEMTGFELLTAINREMLDIKFGFVTTETSEARIREARDAGVHFIVNKPFAMETLHKAVTPMLEKIRLESGDNSVDSASLSADEGDRSRTLSAKHYDEDANSASSAPQSLEDSSQVDVNLPSVEQLEQAINRIGSREVFMEAMSSIEFTDGSLPGALVLFSDGHSSQVRALAILDLSAVCILGGSFQNMNEDKIQQVIAQGLIKSEISNSCERMFERLCGEEVLNLSASGHKLQVMRFSQIQQIFPKLETMLSTPAHQRIDCDLAAIGYGQGSMTLMLST
ncbi:MAG: response regulator [Cellvibrionaceae bacterium]